MIHADLPHFSKLGPDFPLSHVNLDFYADCIERIRAASGHDRLAVAGHSHHGNVALEYAKRFPDRVSRLILINSPPVGVRDTLAAAERFWAEHATSYRRNLLAERRAALSARGSVATSGQNFVAQYVADAPLYWYRPRFDATPLWHGVPIATRILPAFRAMFSQYTMSWDVGAMPAPVLVITGTHDFAVPPSLWAPQLAGLPNLSLCQIERCGHTPQLERPNAFDPLILSWLRQ